MRTAIEEHSELLYKQAASAQTMRISKVQLYWPVDAATILQLPIATPIYHKCAGLQSCTKESREDTCCACGKM